ncbi:MAG: ribosome recycling factor [Erysipelotrichales bacterium]|nr:ribosome recycling factor [Erysipelotrichales bacterium]
MQDTILLNLEESMEKSILALRREFQTIRTGRANPQILDSMTIDYYGTQTPIKQLAGITAPEASQLLIKPFDKSTLKAIEQAINDANLGLSPQSDGLQIRLIFPRLTEERRKELVKVIAKMAENGKVSVRNERRNGVDAIKKLSLPEDEERVYLDEIQKLTDKFVAKADEELKIKEKELMTI